MDYYYIAMVLLVFPYPSVCMVCDDMDEYLSNIDLMQTFVFSLNKLFEFVAIVVVLLYHKKKNH